ncbi:glycosyltransferase family 1 protein [Mycetocola manganoxydans]|uniref:Glycosyltransferase family 1 protein n=1 Tax=Mycetocola manganoxydans TaxID=699879 RepID=A0A3L7A100_9MICO|nr:glycosyltransferase family 1 protein [Mycetocola manganoxydans]RLP73889.1 glycosyltransferase family 1 protein [Mycetocola manganoxydans]GHD42503.1 glycosyl transferase [Mycetocola manganoxydans]
MATILRMVVDQMITPAPNGISRYTEELTRALVSTAPRGCSVEGIVSALPQEKIARIEEALPGLSQLHRTTLPRRELAAAWQLGIVPTLGTGMIHSPSLLAPLRRHDREFDQTQMVVTIHDTLAWSDPKSLTPTSVAWHKAMAKRARKHADAIVVPTHAVAEQLSDIIDFGDRVRVISGAVASNLTLPDDADERAARMELPEEFMLTVGTLDPRRGLTPLITGLGQPDAPDLPLLVLGPETWGELALASVADEAGLAEGRVRALGYLSDADLAVVLARTSVFIYPSLREGFGLPLVEAFTFGAPVVHSDDPALVEVAGGAGLAVERGAKGYPERLAAAVASVLADSELADRMRIAGQDRARAFSWRDSAERVWALHADL